MIVLEASVVIAFLDASDTHHEAAVAFFADNSASGYELHQLTLAEILVGGVRAGRANQLLADLRAIGIAPAESPHDEPLILAELRTVTGLKMPDCCVLAVALRESAALATFDEQLARVAVSLGLRVLPGAG